MQRIADGQEEAFRILVSRWEKPVFGFCYHMLHSVEDAEDLSQELFMRVYRQAQRYRPEGRFRSWLFRIAGNSVRSRLRRRRLVQWVRFDPSRHDRPDFGVAPDGPLQDEQLREVVRAALAKLPFRQRQAVVLRRYQDLSYQEIADVLDTSRAAVESLLQRAAAALRQEFAGRSISP